MYRVVFYRLNERRTRDFATFHEAIAFWGRLPFETFSELYKL